MMKISFKCGAFGFVIEAQDEKDFMVQAGRVFELFRDPVCLMCRSTEGVAPRVREAGGFTFYEMYCLNRTCRAKLEFGQENDEKAGNPLFPKRKNADGGFDQFQGWKRWVPEGEHEEPSRSDAMESRVDTRPNARPMPATRPMPTPASLPPIDPADEAFKTTTDYKELLARMKARQTDDVFNLLLDRITKAPQGGDLHARSAWVDATAKDPNNDIVIYTELYKIHLRYVTPAK